jgi:hypothetical protein
MHTVQLSKGTAVFQIEFSGKTINIFKSLARSNVFSTKSEEQEVNLVWINLCIF